MCSGVDVLAKLVGTQKSTHFPSFLPSSPPSSSLRLMHPLSLSVSPSLPLLFSHSPSKSFSLLPLLSFFFSFFSLVHSLPTQRYEPSHLLHDRKGEEGVESGGERGRKVCKAVYINDVRKPAIDIELIFKFVCVPVATCSANCCSTVHCQGSLLLTFHPLTE